MGDASRIRSALDGDGGQSSEDLLPLVYDELRKLAAHRMARETPGQTLQATALVHEVYLRLNDVESAPRWRNRAHFFGAAAEAMRRILIERARRKGRIKHGGGKRRIDIDAVDFATTANLEELLAIDQALEGLTAEDDEAAQLVRLHIYAGLPVEEAGRLLDLTRTAAYELWCYARAHLRVALE
jgi:RNA polymerase sigma factor (TIGR02999 family)